MLRTHPRDDVRKCVIRLDGVPMVNLEDEMRHEIEKLEKEISVIDEDLQKLRDKMLRLMEERKKKTHDLRILKVNFGLQEPESDIQVTLDRILKERYMKA